MGCSPGQEATLYEYCTLKKVYERGDQGHTSGAYWQYQDARGIAFGIKETGAKPSDWRVPRVDELEAATGLQNLQLRLSERPNTLLLPNMLAEIGWDLVGVAYEPGKGVAMYAEVWIFRRPIRPRRVDVADGTSR